MKQNKTEPCKVCFLPTDDIVNNDMDKIKRDTLISGEIIFLSTDDIVNKDKDRIKRDTLISEEINLRR